MIELVCRFDTWLFRTRGTTKEKMVIYMVQLKGLAKTFPKKTANQDPVRHGNTTTGMC